MRPTFKITDSFILKKSYCVWGYNISTIINKYIRTSMDSFFLFNVFLLIKIKIIIGCD